MIDITDQNLYQSALEALQRYKRYAGPLYKGRFVQIFLALKFYQNSIPSMFSSQFTTTELLQTLLDDLYAKASRPLNHCVLALFENRYHARTGLTSPGNSVPQNTWRNNFNLQKGIGCYAPPSDLVSPTFLDQERINCRHLAPTVPGQLSGAGCSLCPSGARYRNESHRKWLRIDPNGNGYAVVDLLNTINFIPYVAPSAKRIPAIPLIIALYHDSLNSQALGIRSVDLGDFRDDFNFSNTEFHDYFDDNPVNQFNARVLKDYPSVTYTGIPKSVSAQPTRQPRQSVRTRRAPRPVPIPVPSGTPVPPPMANTGWGAEQYVASALQADGWQVFDVSRQQVGFDLLAQKRRQTFFFEVKSSVGQCTPSLTLREWQQAHQHNGSYVLSIIENFDPNGSNTIYWVPDPANSCLSRQTTSIAYAIPRSSWTSSTVPLSSL